MTRAFRLAAGVAAMSLACLAARAAGPSIAGVSSVSGLAYSPDSVAKGTGSVTVQCDGYIGPFCVAFSLLSLESAASPPAESLSWGLYKSAAAPSLELALENPPSSADELLSDGFAPGSPDSATIALGFAALVSPARLPPPGTYTASLRASLYASAYPPSGGPVDSEVFSISVEVGSFFDLSIVAPGSAFAPSSSSGSIDFGPIAPGDSRSLDLLVRSNLRYGLSLSSAHGGALANSRDLSLLAYSLSSNGEGVPLSSSLPSPIASGAAATYGAPERYRLVVAIMSFVGLPTEGDYSDSLTVMLTAP
jgi:hypothetical protein